MFGPISYNKDTLLAEFEVSHNGERQLVVRGRTCDLGFFVDNSYMLLNLV